MHAERIVGGCLVLVDGEMVMGDRGLPEMMVAWLPRDEVTIHDTWHTTGLAGSGSNDYSVTDVFVPEAHGFQPLRPGVRSEPLYRYRGSSSPTSRRCRSGAPAGCSTTCAGSSTRRC